MALAFTKPLVIDSCSMGLLLQPQLLKFWQRFDKQIKHCITHVVYWEYMRGFGPRSHQRPSKNEFLHWVGERAQVLPFELKEADYATAIYIGLAKRQAKVPKKDRRDNLVRLHANIMIAAVAVQHGLQVLTSDIEDWTDIWTVIREDNIGPLGGFAVIDPKDLPS